MQIILRSLSQLFDFKILKIVFKSIFLALFVFMLSLLALHYLLQYLIALKTDNQWFSYLSYLGDIGFIGLSFFLFPAIFIFISSFFLPEVMDRVEKTYYPNLKAKGNPLHAELLSSLKLFLLVFFVNILALPFYLIPVLNIFVYLGVNGFLLGREYFEMVALRFYTLSEIKQLHSVHGRAKFFLGLCFAILGSTPVVNLLSPIFAVLVMSHYVCDFTAKKDG